MTYFAVRHPGRCAVLYDEEDGAGGRGDAAFQQRRAGRLLATIDGGAAAVLQAGRSAALPGTSEKSEGMGSASMMGNGAHSSALVKYEDPEEPRSEMALSDGHGGTGSSWLAGQKQPPRQQQEFASSQPLIFAELTFGGVGQSVETDSALSPVLSTVNPRGRRKKRGSDDSDYLPSESSGSDGDIGEDDFSNELADSDSATEEWGLSSHVAGFSRAAHRTRSQMEPGRLQLRLSPGQPFATPIISNQMDRHGCGLIVRVKRRRSPSSGAGDGRNTRFPMDKPLIPAEVVGVVNGSFSFSDLCDFHYDVGLTPECGESSSPVPDAATDLKTFGRGIAAFMRSVPEVPAESTPDDPSLMPFTLPPPSFLRSARPKEEYTFHDKNRVPGRQTQAKYNHKPKRQSKKSYLLGSVPVGLGSQTKTVAFWDIFKFRQSGNPSTPWPDLPTSPPEMTESCADPSVLEKVKNLFDTRPIWTTRALKAVLRRGQPMTFADAEAAPPKRAVIVGRQAVDESLLKKDIFPRLCYRHSGGPWRSCYIRLGYDPTLPENSGHAGLSDSVPTNDDGFVCLSEMRARNLQVVDVRISPPESKAEERRRKSSLLNHKLAEMQASTFVIPFTEESQNLNSAELVKLYVKSRGISIENLPGWESEVDNAHETAQVASTRANTLFQVCDVISGDRDQFGEFDECAKCNQRRNSSSPQMQIPHAILDSKSGWLQESELSSLAAQIKTKLTESGSKKRIVKRSDGGGDAKRARSSSSRGKTADASSQN